MIGTLLGAVETTNAPFGAGGSTSTKPVAGVSGVSLNAVSPWSREGMLVAGARTSVSTSYATERAAQAVPLRAAPSFVQGPPPSDDGGLPRYLVIGGAAVVGLALVGAVAYKLKKKR